MIYEVEGDLMLSRAQLLAQGVATFDPMNQGFARRLRERYPTMVRDFHRWCEQKDPQPGQIWIWGEPDKQQVVNLITHAGDPDLTRSGRPDKIAVNRALRALSQLYNEIRFKSLAMPTIGAGENALDWAVVRDMIHAQLGELLIPIFVYVRELDGQVAQEPGL